MGQFLLIALTTFASEDLTCIATGALIAAGKIGFVPGVLACVAGIFFGDYSCTSPAACWAAPLCAGNRRQATYRTKLDRASQWFSDRGAGVVILSRFTPGLRLPTYVAAGF